VGEGGASNGNLGMETSALPLQDAPAIEADDTIDDEGFAQSISTSYATSIATAIRRGVEENGRTYPAYGKHLAALPIDESELERNDMQHCKFTLILDGRLHLAPIGDSPQKILDLGTGSGIWAIDMADKYATASVIGVDIAPVQPQWVPPNLQFEIEDIESDWTWAKNSFDFIHARELLLAIRDWPKLMQQSFEHLKPGGYFEVSGTYPNAGCDDGTYPEGSAYAELIQIFYDIGVAIGASSKAPVFWKKQMEDAGFVDVEESIFKIPRSPWPKESRLKKIGAFELAQFREGIGNIFLRGYTQVLKRDADQLQVTLAKAREEVGNRNIHVYIYL
jgi:SAM-dependent methyltransferase